MEEALRELVRRPVGGGGLDDADVSVQAENPVCGDRLVLDAKRTSAGRLVLRWRAEACPAGLALAGLLVQTYDGVARLPAGPPFAALREALAAAGGLAPTERHALALAEEALAALAAALAGRNPSRGP